ncbi:MAG: hypothetical protein L3J46_03800 [Kangiellaceae bacterium]|nr:hypothetical protein [Kangiellaceae bacterium]
MNISSSVNSTKHLSHVIAVIGCDGSGKSTLSADLILQLQKKCPVELVYLGQSSGRIAEWIGELPLIGARFQRYLETKAAKTNEKKKSEPDGITALVIYLLSKWRLHKFRKMLKLNNKKVLIITDRYPQAEVTGFNVDGTGLNLSLSKTWFAKKLATREQEMYRWMSAHVPALLIRLNIDAETAHARKPDHKMDRLEAKIAVIPNLHFNHATILDLDSREPYDAMLKSALKATNQVANNL